MAMSSNQKLRKWPSLIRNLYRMSIVDCMYVHAEVLYYILNPKTSYYIFHQNAVFVLHFIAENFPLLIFFFFLEIKIYEFRK